MSFLTAVMNITAVLLWVYTIAVDLGRTPLLSFIQSSIILFQIAVALSFESELHTKFGTEWARAFRPDTPAKAMILGVLFMLYLLQSALMIILGQSTPPDLMGGTTLAILLLFLTLVFRRAFRGKKDDQSQPGE